jgi:hypothetical protein
MECHAGPGFFLPPFGCGSPMIFGRAVTSILTEQAFNQAHREWSHYPGGGK